jgi:hypothetical protein
MTATRSVLTPHSLSCELQGRESLSGGCGEMKVGQEQRETVHGIELDATSRSMILIITTSVDQSSGDTATSLP